MAKLTPHPLRPGYRPPASAGPLRPAELPAHLATRLRRDGTGRGLMARLRKHRPAFKVPSIQSGRQSFPAGRRAYSSPSPARTAAARSATSSPVGGERPLPPQPLRAPASLCRAAARGQSPPCAPRVLPARRPPLLTALVPSRRLPAPRPPGAQRPLPLLRGSAGPGRPSPHLSVAAGDAPVAGQRAAGQPDGPQHWRLEGSARGAPVRGGAGPGRSPRRRSAGAGGQEFGQPRCGRPREGCCKQRSRTV